MAEDNDTESEDRVLYGDSTPAEAEADHASKGTVEAANTNPETLGGIGAENGEGGSVKPIGDVDAAKAEPKQENALEGKGAAHGTDEGLQGISGADQGTVETGGEAQETEAKVKDEAVEDAVKSAGGVVAKESSTGEETENGGPANDEPDEESGESEEESGSEEDEDDDDEDDDFDVVLNDEDVESVQRPGGPSFGGSIGKVRLPSNKWQRPGYVPPERVIGNAAQTGARTGGVLSMLPTPTMQIGVSQKSVYDLEIGKLTEKPWLERGADSSDYFNYGFNEESWKLYCERQMQMRLEASMLAKIKTVDGNKNVNAAANRRAPQMNQKNLPQQNGSARIQGSGGAQSRSGAQVKAPTPPIPPAPVTGQGVPPPPPGMGLPPGGLPGMPGMMKMGDMPMPPNMPPFPFQPGMMNGKGGGFQPPFPPFPMPGGQRQGDGKNPNPNMFPFLPGMPGMPPGMPMPPGGLPPGMGRGGKQGRGFPGQKQTPQNLQQDTAQGRGIKRPLNDQTSRFGSGAPGGPGKPSVHPSRQGLVQGHQQRQHRQGGAQGGQQDDDRRRWNNSRGTGDRRQGFDRSSSDRGGHSGGQSHGGGEQRGRSGYDDRYGDRGNDRRRAGGWSDNREDGQGQDRRRGGGGYENQRYSDNRRDYDRDRDPDREHYRKRRGGGRDYDEDRKRSRR